MITNIRLGFATNSSSTHSIIIAPPSNKIKDDLDEDSVGNELYFGWDNFTLASSKLKEKYLAGIVYQHLNQYIGKDLAKDICSVWFKSFDGTPIHVDHQSVPSLPLDHEGLGINKQFVMEYRDFLLNPSIIILGGNDNEDNSHPLLLKYPQIVLPLLLDHSQEKLVARKDKRGHWSLFNREDGTKIRMTFDLDQPEITYSSVPELVDLKITDFCQFNCPFCYQGSTPQGKHADISYLRSIIYSLGELRVFEVAIGGGEPTTHPNFIEILNLCQAYHIVPNFTTKDLSWLKDDEKRISILDKIGGFAYSATSYGQVKQLTSLISRYNIPKTKVQVQIVEGTLDNYTLKEIIKECSYHNITLTVLGFKELNRGKTYKPDYNESETWLDVVKDLNEKQYYLPIGVDTCLAKKYEQELKALYIPTKVYHLDEGKFSCYIDACSKMMGPSSYAPD